jgi:hypothetical protein
MKIDPKNDTRSAQKITEEKLATMSKGDIAAVAAQRGYDVDPVSKRISNESFLKQQSESDAFVGSDAHTDSGDIPDTDTSKGVAKLSSAVPNFEPPSTPSVHGGIGGLPAGEAIGSSATGASGATVEGQKA